MPLATSQTSRAAIVSLLPEPAPAMTASGPSGAPITAACSAVGSGSLSTRASCPGVYLVTIVIPPDRTDIPRRRGSPRPAGGRRPVLLAAQPTTAGRE